MKKVDLALFIPKWYIKPSLVSCFLFIALIWWSPMWFVTVGILHHLSLFILSLLFPKWYIQVQAS